MAAEMCEALDGADPAISGSSTAAVLNLASSAPFKQLLMVWRPPAIKLLLLLLRSCNFAAVMNRNVDLYFLMVLGDPCERGQDPQLEN